VRIKKGNDALYARVRQILESAKLNVARSVNTTQVIANWLIGREIVEEEQNGKYRAEYGKRVIEALAGRLTKEFAAGYSAQNLFYMKQFHRAYPRLLSAVEILHAVLGESAGNTRSKNRAVGRRQSDQLRSNTPSRILHAARGELNMAQISDAARREIWSPGLLHPGLSWTHYRTLLRVD